MTNKIQEHFDSIAYKYDEIKENNSYYRDSLNNLFQSFIPIEKRILDIGCGTGRLLRSLYPSYGVGIDISPNMISIAKAKNWYKDVHYYTMEAENLRLGNVKFDYIVLPDVIDHLKSINKTIKGLKKYCKKDTKIIIDIVNPKWNSILQLVEKFGLKMPEGPHNGWNVTERNILNILDKEKFKVVESGYRILLPKKVPILHHVNRFFHRIPLIRKFGLIQYFVVEKMNKLNEGLTKPPKEA